MRAVSPSFKIVVNPSGYPKGYALVSVW